MLDDLFEAVLGGPARIIGRMLIEFIFELVFYVIGYPIVKMLTLGKYPTKPSSDLQDSIVSIVGLIIVILIAVVLITMS